VNEARATAIVESDEDLVDRLREGNQGALATLFARYAPLVFHIASQSLGVSAAEEIVQEVFFSVWRRVESFDRKRGAFRPWLLQVAHFRVLNELRSRRRRPKSDPDTDLEALGELPDDHAGPIELAWEDYRRQAVRAAVDKLPPNQRQALSLAFFEELSHDQVAEALKIPLGTAKTRIRSGVRKLRRILLPLGIVTAFAAGLLLPGVIGGGQGLERTSTGRALAFVTASDITQIHLPAVPGLDPLIHGSYRGREGSAMAVVALHNLPLPSAGGIYRVWVRKGQNWISLGEARLSSGGNALIVSELPALRGLPDAIQVREEIAAIGAFPSGKTVIAWIAASPRSTAPPRRSPYRRRRGSAGDTR